MIYNEDLFISRCMYPLFNPTMLKNIIYFYVIFIPHLQDLLTTFCFGGPVVKVPDYCSRVMGSNPGQSKGVFFSFAFRRAHKSTDPGRKYRK